jgi:endonuclease-3
MNEAAVRDRLIQLAESAFRAQRAPEPFTRDPGADSLLNDIEGHPHAFVLACIMDRQVKAEIAWKVPYELSKRIGGFSIARLQKLSSNDVMHLMKSPRPLHRMPEIMSVSLHSAVRRISDQYGGNAARIWNGNPSSAEVVYRFLEFDGVGPKIATMAVNLLARIFKVPLSDFYSVDISADVHIRRVFARLGLCPTDADTEQIIYKARALHPEFPGMMDSPCWDIGRTWCKPSKPLCGGCPMAGVCGTAETAKVS